MTEIRHIITEDWEEQLLRDIVGDEEVSSLKWENDKKFDKETEYLEITVKRIPK